MNKDEKTEQLISRVDNYLTLMRYNYSTQEKLARLEILKDYYSSAKLVPSNEVIICKFEMEERLSKKLVLPLKVRGVFLTEGRPKRKYYHRDELQSAINNPLNQRFPLMLDHRDREASKVVGMVDKIEYAENIMTPKGVTAAGIKWWGHINDETFARNVMDSAIKEVSVTVVSSEEFSEEFGVIGKNLVFKELSLVMDGADAYNYVEVDG